MGGSRNRNIPQILVKHKASERRVLFSDTWRLNKSLYIVQYSCNPWWQLIKTHLITETSFVFIHMQNKRHSLNTLEFLVDIFCMSLCPQPISSLLSSTLPHRICIIYLGTSSLWKLRYWFWNVLYSVCCLCHPLHSYTVLYFLHIP